MEHFWLEVGDFLYFTGKVFFSLIVIALVIKGIQKFTKKDEKVVDEGEKWMN